MPVRFERGPRISTIHNRILKQKEAALIKEIREKAPQIEKEKIISDFVKAVNLWGWKQRLSLIWRIFRRKL